MTGQLAYRVRFGWGRGAVDHLAAHSDVVVIVDVLSFSTCIDIATERGAEIIPWDRDEDAARVHATRTGAILAARRGSETPDQPYTLSPASLTGIPAGTRLVLPSPNGSTLASRAADHAGTVIAGCLRNRSAVGITAAGVGRTIAVIAAGELWPDGQLRPAGEDLLGAGAILEAIGGDTSPDAWLAIATFRAAREHLATLIQDGDSGRELRERGYPDDLRLALEMDASPAVPVLRDGRFAAI
ncbi:MAG TPA: 2-phosphosulfolactate phosphatase [Thermomicrobiales bacterium]|nr:2-phosphosulfolactate phosphatase [Thermomicrobiales bacterium]